MGNVVALPARRKLPRYGDAHIAAGEYAAVLLGYETWARFRGWSPRVVMVWGIVDSNAPADNIVVPGYYAVRELKGKPKVGGKFLIGSKSRLFRDMARMMGTRPPVDYIPVDELDRHAYRIVLRDVDRDQFQLDLPVKYSVVSHVLGRD